MGMPAVGFRGLIAVTAISLIALLPPAIQLRASECGCTSCGPDCPTVVPIHESFPGWNLYWHNTCEDVDWRHPCPWKRDYSTAAAPAWYAGAELLALFRDQEDEFTFATPIAGLALSSSDFDTAFDAGVRGWLGYSLGDWYRIETSYFGTHQWSDTLVGTNMNGTAAISFHSELDNVELNLRRRVELRPSHHYAGEVSVLVGARYMRLNESFTNAVTLGTNNEMIGPQLGILGQFLVQPRGWIDFELKGAVFQNNVAQSLPNVGTIEENRTAFLGDISLSYNYHFAESWTFRAGYNAYWLTGVGLAAENFQGNLLAGVPVVSHASEVVYHGFHLGLVYVR